MSNPELSTVGTAATVLEDIVTAKSFDNFLHFKEMNDFCKREGIDPTDNWSVVLREWPYDPLKLIEDSGRGNCVDFALYTQKMLGDVGVQSVVIGKKPESLHTAQGEEYLFQRHTAVMSGATGQRLMYEPGRRLTIPIHLDPIDARTQQGRQSYRTLDISDEWLVQEQSFSDTGYTGQREFDLHPMPIEVVAALPRRLMRVPRDMEMITLPEENGSVMMIEWKRKRGALVSNIDGLPDEFQPRDISKELNREISARFGFDVKEELIAAMGIFRAFPQDFWVR